MINKPQMESLYSSYLELDLAGVNAPDIVNAIMLLKLISKQASIVFGVLKTVETSLKGQQLLLGLDDTTDKKNERGASESGLCAKRLVRYTISMILEEFS